MTDERSSEDIRRNIEDTRADMDRTVDALQAKLTPGEIIDDLWNRMKGSGAASSLGDMVRDNPMPVALMGLGLAWLAIDRSSASRGEQLRRQYGRVQPGTWEAAEGRRGPYMPDEVSLRGRGDDEGDESGGFLSRASDVASGVAEKAGHLKDAAGRVIEGVSGAAGSAAHAAGRMTRTAREKASDFAGRARDSGEGMGERLDDVRHRASRVSAETRYQARQMKNQISNLFDEYPLALGAVAFGIGLAAGASAPSTRVEDELMGEAAATLKDEMKDVAGETAGKAKAVVQETVQAVKEEAQQQAKDLDVGGRVERVVERAVETAERKTEDEGLTAEQLAERGKQIGERTARKARREAPPSQR